MGDSLRGAAAIVGIGELKPERTRPGRDAMSLLAEAAYLAIQDAGLTKADIDGMICLDSGSPGDWLEVEVTGSYETDLVAQVHGPAGAGVPVGVVGRPA